jgi:hypothetical protein
MRIPHISSSGQDTLKMSLFRKKTFKLPPCTPYRELFFSDKSLVKIYYQEIQDALYLPDVLIRQEP